ncbi:hypothetical protein [Frankia sp. R43]|uniref:hypothetical protein n=1 Tax=Frankia sp. R43 TaxID=269536 RepID=UPI0006CA1B1C|nr:hypothetical protein [Frankia sp. R43]
MSLYRLRVTVCPHPGGPDRSDRPAFSVPFLTGGCPLNEPRWSRLDGVYGPHEGTVCPDCLPRWSRHADISAPYPNHLPPPSPLVVLQDPVPAPNLDGVDPDLATRLTEAGFTRAGRLPLPGLPRTSCGTTPATTPASSRTRSGWRSTYAALAAADGSTPTPNARCAPAGSTACSPRAVTSPTPKARRSFPAPHHRRRTGPSPPRKQPT